LAPWAHLIWVLPLVAKKIADFMLQALEQEKYIRQYPAIAEALI